MGNKSEESIAVSLTRRAFKNSLIFVAIIMVIWAIVLEFISQGWWVLVINIGAIIVTAWTILSCAIPFFRLYMPGIVAFLISGTLWFVMFIAIRLIIGAILGTNS